VSDWLCGCLFGGCVGAGLSHLVWRFWITRGMRSLRADVRRDLDAMRRERAEFWRDIERRRP
jgi:hypothetical protein